MATQTPNYLTQVGDEVRPMTDTEKASLDELISEQNARLDELKAKQAAAASARAKLAALGLTEAEVAAILGA